MFVVELIASSFLDLNSKQARLNAAVSAFLLLFYFFSIFFLSTNYRENAAVLIQFKFSRSHSALVNTLLIPVGNIVMKRIRKQCLCIACHWWCSTINDHVWINEGFLFIQVILGASSTLCIFWCTFTRNHWLFKEDWSDTERDHHRNLCSCTLLEIILRHWQNSKWISLPKPKNFDLTKQWVVTRHNCPILNDHES